MMNRLFLSVLCAVLVFGNSFGQAAKHVVLITIDGFRPDFYLDESWGAVNLQQMAKEGVRAKAVRGIFPTVTFPSHTTLVTGERPDKHGIYFNNPFQPNGPSVDWHWYYEAITATTLWDALRKEGHKTGAVLWPVTVGAPIDYNVPDIFLIGNSDRLEITGRYTMPEGFWEEIQQGATGKLEANDFNLDKDYLSMDENIARMAGYIIRQYKPAFIALHLPVVDHAEHVEGRDGDGVRRAVAGADRCVRTVVEALDKAGILDHSAVIVTGDHGFVDRHTYFAPNVLLANAGLIGDVPSGDWKARFHSAGGSAFLYLKSPRDKRSLSQVKKILSDLPDSLRSTFRIIEGEELRKSGADPNAVLALTGERGYAFSGAVTGKVTRPSRGGTHGYFPDIADIHTGFVGFGAGFRKGVEVPMIEMVDIAPIIAELLGVGFKKADPTVYRQLLTGHTE